MLIWIFMACELAATALEQQRSALERRSTAHQTDSGVQWYELGAGPTVVLVHGFGDQGASWLSVAASLSETNRVVVVDLPGHGRSARPQSMDFAGMQAGLQDALGAALTEPATLVGNSMGGWLVLAEGLDHPEHALRVVPVNAAGLRHTIPRDVLVPQTTDAVQEKIETMGMSMSVPGFMLRSIIDAQDTDFLLALYDGLEAGPFLDDRLAAMQPPVDLIWGDQDGFFPMDYATRMQAGLPSGRLRVLDGCSHAPQVDCADQLVAELRALP